MLRVVGVGKVTRNIRSIVATVRFAHHEDLVALHAESLYEILPEPQKLRGKFVFIMDGSVTSGKADGDGLFDPHNVGEMMPAPGVGNRLQRARSPDKRPVLLKEAEQGGAAGL